MIKLNDYDDDVNGSYNNIAKQILFSTPLLFSK